MGYNCQKAKGVTLAATEVPTSREEQRAANTHPFSLQGNNSNRELGAAAGSPTGCLSLAARG